MIYIAENASELERWAAEQLVEYCEKSTGIFLQIQNSDDVEETYAIILGDHPFIHQNHPEIKYDSLGDEGYHWKFYETGSEQRIILAGSSKRGAVYAVIDFLERFFGIRFYDLEYTKIPHNETISIPNLDEQHHPDFEYRMVTYLQFLDPDFSVYQKVNMNPFSEDYNGGSAGKLSTAHMTHTFIRLLPPSKYFDEHPEYFSLINGKRVAGLMSQLCLSNPKVKEIAANQVLQWFKDDPTILSVGVIPNDADGYCECDQCRAIEEQYGKVHSAPLIQLCNYIGDALAKEYSDKFIHTTAYTYYLEPPKGMNIRDNIIIIPCDMYPNCCDNKPIGKHPSTERFYEILQEWRKIASKVFVWHYCVDFIHFDMIFPNFKALYDDIQIYKKLGYDGILFQADTRPGVRGEFDVFRNWFLNKLMWDSSQSFEDLVDDFIGGYYGPAHSVVKDYFYAIHEFADDPNTSLHLYSGLEGIPTLTPEFVLSWRNKIIFARDKLDSSSPFYNHLDHVIFTLDYTYLIFPIEYEVKMGYIYPKNIKTLKPLYAHFKKCLKTFQIGVVSESLPVPTFTDRYDMICQKTSIMAIAELAPVALGLIEQMFTLVNQHVDEKNNIKINDFIQSSLKRGFHPLHLNNWMLEKQFGSWTHDADIWTRKIQNNTITKYLKPDLPNNTLEELPKAIKGMVNGIPNQKEEL